MTAEFVFVRPWVQAVEAAPHLTLARVRARLRSAVITESTPRNVSPDRPFADPGRSTAGRRTMSDAREPDQPVLARVASGEPAAMQELMKAYGGLVWSLALRFCPTRDDAEDATQDIFTDIWKSAHRYREQRASERVFISMIARRRLIDRIRREKRRREFEPFAAGPASDQQISGDSGERGWDAEQAAGAIQELSADQRQVLEMSIGRGMTQREIAEATSTPLGTVKTHMRRGLIRLRERMAAQDEASAAAGADTASAGREEPR